MEEVTLIAVLPNWLTQIWWSRSIWVLIPSPILLPNTKTTLYLLSPPATIHTMYSSLQLLFCLLSGDHSNQLILTEATDLIISAWGESTIKQYKPCFKRWTTYCHQWQIDPLRAAVTVCLNFLASLFQSGSSYSAIKTAQSALSSILPMQDNTQFGSHPLVSCLVKGGLEDRPNMM